MTVMPPTSIQATLAPQRIVVVGASLAGLRTAEALRHAGFEGTLTIVGAETHAPYNRPPLTKASLVDGPDRHNLALPHADLDATWILGVAATRLDLAHREVELDNGESVHFDGLVIATGASARRLPADIGDADVHYIRTLEDAAALHQALTEPVQRVLVIGAGFLGSEVASTAAMLGHRVTLVEATAGPMLGALGAKVSAYAAQLHRNHGVDLRTSTTVVSLSRVDGVPGRATAVLAHHADASHSRTHADIVVAALGAAPNTGWLHGCGVDVDSGVLTDDSLTMLDAEGQPVHGIVAVGDVARVPQPLLDGAPARVEHWATAVGHSRIAAATLIGHERPAGALLPPFWTDQHGVQIRGVGLPGAADTTALVDGAVEDHRFVMTLSRGGRPVGVVAVNNAPALLRYRAELETTWKTPPTDTVRTAQMTDTSHSPTLRPTSIKAVRNGPLQLKGTFRLLDPDGEEYDLGGQRIVLLCRCGQSKNQPFCDSSHVRNVFVTHDQPTACDQDDVDQFDTSDDEGAA